MTWVVLVASWTASLVLLARLAAVRESAARASHEVRGPLTAASLALHGAGASGDRLRALAAQLERAQRALDDLTGTARDRMEPVAAAALMASVAEAWRPVAAARGRALRVEPERTGAAVVGDRVRLAQAVGNLVANALEHGDGAVAVRCSEIDGRLRIEVRDDGPGLPAPLARLVRGRLAGFGARGRGLAIAAGVARTHGGSLTAPPGPGGAMLALELPMLAAGGERPAGSSAAGR